MCPFRVSLSPRIRIALIYGLVGGAFGLWPLIGYLSNYLPDDLIAYLFGGLLILGGGAPFLAALALSTWLVARTYALRFDVKRRYLLESAGIILLAYPISMGLGGWVYFLCGSVFFKRLGWDLGEYVFCFYAPWAALLVWAALCTALGQWRAKPLAQLLASGVLWAALFSSPWGHTENLVVNYIILFVGGYALFAAICGYAIAKNRLSSVAT